MVSVHMGCMETIALILATAVVAALLTWFLTLRHMERVG